MTVVTKLITGIHCTSPVTLFVEGTPNDPAPPLVVLERGSSTPVTIYYNSTSGGWTTPELEDTDYIMSMSMDDEDWFEDTLDISVVGEGDVVFVFHGPETAPPNEHQTVAWTASTALVGSDPKDPWPPPGQDEFELPSVSRAWFDSELHDARVGLATPKAA